MPVLRMPLVVVAAVLPAAASLVAPLGAQGGEPELGGAHRAVEAAAERYREIGAFCADFAQTIEVKLLGRRVESSGELCRRHPDLFSMRFADPEGDMVVSDGERLWVYYRSVDPDQVLSYPAASAPGSHDFVLELLQDPATGYALAEPATEVVEGRECRVVDATPGPGARYRGARLWIDGQSHLLRRIELREESGNLRSVELSGYTFSPPPADSLFTFAVPEGVQVVDRPGVGAMRVGR
ncbi:MAG: outer membrane lipoprotein carrier protein LolA [Gemmatimonadetes bacterium]|nr:outer membrane lipoprotein carrier protein LolA [Gemmatimonadota bacterium]